MTAHAAKRSSPRAAAGESLRIRRPRPSEANEKHSARRGPGGAAYSPGRGERSKAPKRQNSSSNSGERERRSAPPQARPDDRTELQPELQPDAQSDAPSPWRAIGAGVESVAMLAAGVAAAALIAGVWQHSHEPEAAVVDGLTLAGESIGGLDRAELEAAAAAASEHKLDRQLRLSAGAVERPITARSLGAVPAPEAVVEEALAYGHSGDLVEDLRARALARSGVVDLRVGMRFESELALEQLLALAPEVDTMSVPTRLDLEAREVLPATRGTVLLPYDSLSSVALGLAAGEDIIELAVAHKPPVEDPLGVIADQLDVGVVLGSFSTPYSMEGRAADRTMNLKVGAAALDGHVLMPGETFSFNEVVGDRSAENGYRYAPGISGGQIIDVLGGGICQIASTLFGASFFGGLEVVRARPHSRPSGYVDMGLDATVAWESIDLVLRNPYDFPVVLHVSVNQGQVQGEVLGPRRPYQVAFERSLKDSMPFETVERADPKLRTGTSVVVQRGMRGFKLERVRKFYAGGEVVREDSWDLTYPATRKIVRVGTNPAGEEPKEKSLAALRDPAASMRIMQ